MNPFPLLLEKMRLIVGRANPIKANPAYRTPYREIGLEFARIDLGAPSKNCRNFGVCQIEPLGAPGLLSSTFSPQQRQGIVHVLLKSWTEVDFIFLNSTLHPHTVDHFFNRDSFLVDEKFTFQLKDYVPNGLVKVSVFPGEYRITKLLSATVVHFSSAEIKNISVDEMDENTQLKKLVTTPRQAFVNR